MVRYAAHIVQRALAIIYIFVTFGALKHVILPAVKAGTIE